MTYTFGGVWPSIVGSVVVLIFMAIYRVVQVGLLRIAGMVRRA